MNDRGQNYGHSQSEAAYLSHDLDEFDKDSISIDFMKYLRVFVKWWWLIFLLVGAALAAAVVLTNRTVPIYKADAILEIKQQEANVLDVNGVEQIVANGEYMVTQLALLRSSALAKRVVETLGLHSNSAFANQTAPLQQRMDQAVGNFKRNVKIGSVGRSRLIKLSYEDARPALAAKISNSLAENFISYNLERRYSATSYARDFVEERLATTKEVLEKSERELAKYAEQQQILDLSNGRSDGVNSNADTLSGAALFALNAEYTKAQSKSIELGLKNKQMQGNQITGDVLNSEVLIELRSEKRGLEAEYQEKLELMKPEFPNMRELAAKISILDEQLLLETANIRQSVQSRYEEALFLEKSLAGRLEKLKQGIRTQRNDSIEYNILLREVDINRTQYEGLLQRLKDLTITDGIGPNLVSIVDRAQTPKKPIKPNLLTNLLFALMLGSALSAAVVLAIELLDDKIKDPQDITAKLSLPALGVVPIISGKQTDMEHLQDSKSSLSEAYASIRTNLMPAFKRGEPICLQVTSTRGSEGKSLSVYALAKSFADLKMKTIIIDADMRKPTFSKGRGSSIGLSGMLTSLELLRDNFVSTKIENLYLLPCGKKPQNPPSLLSSPRFVDILDQAKAEFDVVIVDSPPVLGLADAPIIGAACQATLFLIEFGNIRTPIAKASIQRLRASKSNILGAILNKYKASSNRYMDYYYYSYGEQSQKYGMESAGGKTSVFGKLKPAKKRRKLDII